ncbi:MAG: 16S rRNA (guanine(527)-N(7))-methyltransferase RsmG [Hydrogenophaga sp.]|uniref:16S rRNA (guanine(527)-N(7))-methyltransferase RsmG n=1 Tax=Hydrogenophaga sp. TaxID=1904254 RepID=UPI0025BEBECD|nr:16S rRNA (guanine(527)-N(7))-methyltransferase RsmG [Hydrogenophaga sp.]MBT9554278.1 16S rRNA (guanine(527)-N(7))-methyltransferase RsmG [Hydrogenophaga sp.]
MSAVTLKQALEAGLLELGLDLSAAQVDQLLAYQDLIAKWNKVYNLTAVRDPQEMLTHHLLDSLAAIPPLLRQTGGQPGFAAGPPQGETAPTGGSDPRSGGAWGPPIRLLDVGSGGGLPGVVIAITCPQIQVHCVDTVLKKATFIQQVAASLKLPNLRGIHARVESLKAEEGGGYDVVCSRAFASLVDFTVWSSSALKPGAVWMAMKGKHPADELAALPASVAVFHVEQLTVPGLEAERCIVWLRSAASLA